MPTYNYMVVHAHGPLQTYDDPRLLERNVRALTELHEARFAEPWSVDDAPADYVQGLLKGIVGIEIPIARLEGKWKLSQNRLPRTGKARSTACGQAGDPLSAAMADWIAFRKP